MLFRPSILERCILKVSTSSVAVGTDDLDKRSENAENSFNLIDLLILVFRLSKNLTNLLPCRPPLGRCYPRLPDPANTETNAAVLKRRQKQIQYGKNTSGYQNYLQQVPK